MEKPVKQRMIERTAVLLAKKGLQGTSFSEVLQASGAPRGSLYHHFPGGKDELVIAAIGVAGNQAMTFLGSTEGKSAVEIAEAFIGLWRTILQRSQFAAGCAVVAVTVAADSPPMLERAGEIFRQWRHWLAAILADGGVPKDRAASLAASLIAACEGAVILARAERSMETFELVASAQLAMIAEACTVTNAG